MSVKACSTITKAYRGTKAPKDMLSSINARQGRELIRILAISFAQPLCEVPPTAFFLQLDPCRTTSPPQIYTHCPLLSRLAPDFLCLMAIDFSTFDSIDGMQYGQTKLSCKKKVVWNKKMAENCSQHRATLLAMAPSTL